MYKDKKFEGKYCGGCELVKMEICFDRDAAKRDGLNSRCKACRNKAAEKRNPGKTAAYLSRRYQ